MNFLRNEKWSFDNVIGKDILGYSERMKRKKKPEKSEKKPSLFGKQNPAAGGVKAKMDAFKKRNKEPEPKRAYGYYDKGRRKETHMSAEEAKRMAPASAAPSCQYCGGKGHIKTAKEYKGLDVDSCYWVCPTCEDVCVTTITGTYYPSGLLANATLRRLRSDTHKQLTFKKEQYRKNHTELQFWMAEKLQVDREEAKIGMLSEEQLKRLVSGANREYYEVYYADIFER